MTTECDYAVLGAGINGSWSAYHLAKRGHSTTLVEQVHLLKSPVKNYSPEKIDDRVLNV